MLCDIVLDSILLYLASNAQSITTDSLTDEVTDVSEALWGNLVEHPKAYTKDGLRFIPPCEVEIIT